MFQLGRALSLGNKRLEAIKYYLDAADRGHAGAMNDLGGVFEYGIGVPKNFATALVWYERAAEFGHAGAMTHLGQLSEDGLDVPQDFANARHWYEKAAALGNAAVHEQSWLICSDMDGEWSRIYLRLRTGTSKQPN